MKNNSNQIAALKRLWERENYIEKGERIENDLKIVEQITEFFSPGMHYHYVFSFDIMQMEYVKGAVEEILEIQSEEFSLEKMLSLYHPEDIEHMKKKELLASNFLFKEISPDQILDYKVVYINRILTPSGKEKTILHQAKAISLSEERVSKVLGVHADITYLNVPLDQNVSFLSQKHPSYFSVPTSNGFVSKKDLFTDREVEIIELISDGASAKEIADTLHISLHTVKTHRKNILKKAQVKNAAQLIAYCIRNGIV